MHHRLLHALILFALPLMAACGTPSSHATQAAPDDDHPVSWDVTPQKKPTSGHPARVRYLAYRTGQFLELVNESHSDPVKLYSSKRSPEQAMTKVQTDEVVQALLERLDDLGALKKAQPGAAPRSAPSASAQALEIETQAGIVSWVLTEGTSAADRRLFQACAKDFVDLYNATVGWQSVDRPPDWNGASGTRKPSGSGKSQ